jgi:hypothetical protein
MYTQDEIKLWIARAAGFATSTVSHGACANIAEAQLKYNKMYENVTEEVKGGYTKDEIKLWIARAGGFATSTVSQEVCASIAKAELEYNERYGKQPLWSLKELTEKEVDNPIEIQKLIFSFNEIRDALRMIAILISLGLGLAFGIWLSS